MNVELKKEPHFFGGTIIFYTTTDFSEIGLCCFGACKITTRDTLVLQHLSRSFLENKMLPYQLLLLALFLPLIVTGYVHFTSTRRSAKRIALSAKARGFDGGSGHVKVVKNAPAGPKTGPWKVTESKDDTLDKACAEMDSSCGDSLLSYLNPKLTSDPAILESIAQLLRHGQVVVLREALNPTLAEITHRDLRQGSALGNTMSNTSMMVMRSNIPTYSKGKDGLRDSIRRLVYLKVKAHANG